MFTYFDTHTHKKGLQGYADNVCIVENIRFAYDVLPIKFDNYFSIGIHPYDIGKIAKDSFLELEKIAVSDKCIAIGECGIDKRRPDIERQIEIFKCHIAVAEKVQKPLIIHCVNAENEILKLTKAFSNKIIFHGYAKYDETIAKRENIMLSLGVAAARHPKVNQIPLSKILLESDDSDVDIESIYYTFASIFDIDKTDLVNIIYNNFYNTFKIL